MEEKFSKEKQKIEKQVVNTPHRLMLVGDFCALRVKGYGRNSKHFLSENRDFRP